MNDLVQKHMINRNIQIGNICSQFAHLELLLAQAIWAALDLDEKVGLSVTGGLSIEARARLAAKLCAKQGKSDKVTKELETVRRELQASKIIEQRNRAIHGHRFPDPNDPAAEMVVIHRGKDAGRKIKRTDAELAHHRIQDTHKLDNLLQRSDQ